MQQRAYEHRWLFALLLGLFLHLPVQTAAQGAGPSAKQLFREGVQATGEERWADARRAFVASLELEERSATLLNLAVVEVQLRKPMSALALLDRLELMADTKRHASRLAQARELRGRALGLVAVLTLEVEPANAALQVDGTPSQGRGARRKLRLDPGAHTLELSADGFEPLKREVELGDAERKRLQLALTALPVAATVPEPPVVAEAEASNTHVEPASAPSPSEPNRDGVRRRRWWIATSAAVVALAAGGVTAWALTRDTGDDSIEL